MTAAATRRSGAAGPSGASNEPAPAAGRKPAAAATPPAPPADPKTAAEPAAPRRRHRTPAGPALPRIHLARFKDLNREDLPEAFGERIMVRPVWWQLLSVAARWLHARRAACNPQVREHTANQHRNPQPTTTLQTGADVLGMERQRFAEYVYNNSLQRVTPKLIERQLKVLMKLFKCTREVAAAALVGQGRCGRVSRGV